MIEEWSAFLIFILTPPLRVQQQDEEMRLLFGEALDSKTQQKEKSKRDKQKQQADKLRKDESDKVKLLKDYPFIADEMLAMSGYVSSIQTQRMAILPAID